MANRTLFQTIAGKMAPRTDALNHHTAPAFQFSPKHELAQYAATGCLNGTFYASAGEQLDRVLSLAGSVEPEFVAKTAIYARQLGHMKDMPALLCAMLAVRDGQLLQRVFPRVIDNGKMLRNFVQIVRSGVVGRKSLGSLPKRLVADWMNGRSEQQLFEASIGRQPSLADVIKMVHPRPASPARDALYAYLIGRPHDAGVLPEVIRDFEAFKKGDTAKAPDVPFQMLTALDLKQEHWVEIARNASWQTTRMNLNTFLRHRVFEVPGMARLVSRRLANPEQVRKARVFPYQLMAAYASVHPQMPAEVKEAVQEAMEIATQNVPAIEGKAFLLPDISGSMQMPVTGVQRGATSAVRCIDVAALVAATVMRKNPSAEVLPFGTDVCRAQLNPRDSVMTNAQRLASMNGGGTNCSAPLRELNKRRAMGDLLLYISDNESWIDAPHYGRFGGGSTATMKEWMIFKQRNPNARMVCIDIQPYGTTQAAEREDILNIGGFSDTVFTVIALFVAGKLSAAHWVAVIEEMEL